MRKIISLFERDYEGTRLVIDKVVEGAEWVIAGEGIATRKYDGTCCLFRDGQLYKRVEWDAQKGPAPASWLHWDFDPAQRSGHGWLPVGDGPEDWLHREAFARGGDDLGSPFVDGKTYELCGPKVQKNPEGYEGHFLVPHGRDVLGYANPRTFTDIRDYLADGSMEGIVWHHPDGRMVKIKGKDFGIKRAK